MMVMTVSPVRSSISPLVTSSTTVTWMRIVSLSPPSSCPTNWRTFDINIIKLQGKFYHHHHYQHRAADKARPAATTTTVMYVHKQRSWWRKLTSRVAWSAWPAEVIERTGSQVLTLSAAPKVRAPACRACPCPATVSTHQQGLHARAGSDGLKGHFTGQAENLGFMF